MTSTYAQRPWLSSYAPEVAPDVDVPDEPLGAALERAGTAFPERVALDFMGRTTTYAELTDEVDRAASALISLGVKPGDRVAIALPNCAAHVVAFYAVLRIGAVVVEHNPTYTESELEHQLADSGAVVAICWEDTAVKVLAVAARTEVRTVVAVDMSRDLPGIKRLALSLPIKKARELKSAMRTKVPDGTLMWHTLLRGASPLEDSFPRPRGGDLALLQYTGGTTGTPKGAMLTHRNLVANAVQGAEWTGAQRKVDAGEPGEVVYGVLPFFHAFGLTLCLSYTLAISATLVLFPKFDVASVLEAQRRRPGTFLPAVPPMLDRLTAGAVKKNADLTSFRYAICGAMPMSAATAQGWERLTGGLAIEGYGMTETSPVALGSPLSDARRPGMLGLPFPSTDIRVTDPDDPTKEVAPGERGELLIAGPQVFDGYWRRPQETADSLVVADGKTWVRTGDVVVMDGDGFVEVVDRIKEMIITGGFKVFPSQVEECLRRMPGVADAAVVGLPGGELGEKVVAALVLAADATGIDLEAVRAWCEKNIARYALPKQLVILPDLPRSQIGKVLRRVVRDQVIAAG
ncbi:long-chain acyl-CoA synthetase [Sanguibacter gelidistatuariae]|uniref:Long-chain acyl-CoA synthetase n=1 Tax=Sanguibacter gelidistatuariae TaxID=1814289 RepID=A0A1G6JPS3_9MICO|nr:AMP-binding protein [Sanguibacter gelidistatuariae]SDC19966.1 long-chain acyl-CoA synthetase [Sanguibacter gelidistatuariae]